MAVLVTEDWKGARLSTAPPWRATRSFTVTGASTPLEAKTQGERATGTRLPKYGDRYGSTAMTCTGLDLGEVKGPSCFVFNANYESQSGDQDSDPNATSWRWNTVYTSEQSDRDVEGNPIINAAGDLYNPKPSLEFVFKTLTVWRPEPFYDISKSINFENTVNSEQFTICGVPVAKEHCRCVTIQPSGEQTDSMQLVKIEYVFEIIFSDALGQYPFQCRLPNVGMNGWYLDGATEKAALILDKYGKVIPEPTMLNFDGVPMKDGLTVGGNVATSRPLSITFDPYKQEITNEAYWLIYKRRKTADHLSLGL